MTENILPTQQQWPKPTLHLLLLTHFTLWPHLYPAAAWPETISHPSKRSRVTGRISEKPAPLGRELIHKREASLTSSASGTGVNYITLFGSELTILFIPCRQINFASVPLCAPISCFLDVTPLKLPTNRTFLLAFLLPLNLSCSLHYFAQWTKKPKFHISDYAAQLVELFRLFLYLKNQTEEVNVLSILFNREVLDHSTKFVMLAHFPRAWSPEIHRLTHR